MKRLLPLLLVSILLLVPIFKAIPLGHSDITSGSFTVTPQEDTEVMSDAPNSHLWSSNANLQLGNRSSPANDQRGYFKFNMTSAYVGAINITTALLRFYMSNLDFGSLGDVINIWNTNNESWSATTITYNNAPALDIIEVYDVLSTSTPQYYSLWIPSSSNTTQGLGALQNAYDNNETRTFCLGFYLFNSAMEWSTMESSFKPTLTITYTQTLFNESTLPRPSLSNPTNYDAIFYAKEDAVVEVQAPSSNFGSENISQIQDLSGVGYRAYIFLKFNFSIPDIINGEPNENAFTLSGVNWIANSLIFKQYCQYVSEDPTYQGWNIIEGIPRANETLWTQSTITWNNQPLLRGYISDPLSMTTIGFKSFDLSTEESYIRYSIANGYTYTIVNMEDDQISRNAFSNWIMTEWGTLTPYIEIALSTEPQAFSLPHAPLGFSNAHEYLAVQWSITPFIAGNLLSAMVYTVTVVPISFILRKAGKGDFIKWTIIIANFVFLTMFTWFGWLNAGLYIILLILTILFLGGVLKS